MKAEMMMVMKYVSHNVNQAGAVTLMMKSGYDQLYGAKELLKFLQSNITVKVKMLEKKPFLLGTFRLKSISFNQNGESAVKLASITDAVYMERMAEIVTMDLTQVRFEGEIDDDEESE